MNKIAQTPYTPRHEAADHVAWLLMSALPVGVLLRLGIEGFQTTQKPMKETGVSPSGYKMPLRLERKKEEETKLAAETGGFNVNKTLLNLHGKLSDVVYNIFGGGDNPGFFSGSNARTAMEVPWLLGAGVPAMALTALGGFHGTDKIITGLRHKEQEQETQASRKEYERLLQLAMQETQPKQACTLDSLAALRVKAAQGRSWHAPVTEPIAGYGGTAAGILLLLMTLAATGSGKYMWDKTKSRTKSDLVEDARRLRAMRDSSTGVSMYIPEEDEL